MHVNSLRCFDFSERTKSASGRSLKRFLQQSIIPYQELLGNYNTSFTRVHSLIIIPYQELLGNYNNCTEGVTMKIIIPYQELLGNYNTREMRMTMGGIIPYQELPGVYQRGETPATYPFFQNKMRALFSAFSLFFACT